ncbi:resuscitation-promoting factor [Thermomonospora cellulosilytica]|uniref:G5 domain-containing protein n=1 Tax=Thermomonospora cellulosilytica TaxID=1411118 RepID=A0A7W3MX54_9ACTN|nr:resuscitation-promoting factor [Thermomonospora cellulosilytica]MBA9003528.1 hypothetical protein [Thermomonospora cellulosilytica]
MRRTPALVLAAALLAASTSACGGGGGGTRPAAADAPKATPTATPRQIVLTVDGRRTTVTTTGRTVREVLAQANVRLGRFYLVKPGLDEPAVDMVRVRLLLSKPVTRKVKVDPPVRRRKNSRLAAWSEKVVKNGRPGEKLVTTAYVRGKKGKRIKAVVEQKVLRRPVARVVEVGPQPSSVGGEAARLNWPALAKCESGGRPNAVNPAGYYGLYQFSLQTWGSVGGTGLPSNAPAAEQTYRAQLLYNKVNGRWQGQWPHCGKYLFG